MREVSLEIEGVDLDIGRVQEIARTLAQQVNPDTDLISWNDAREERYSPWVPRECACNSEDHAYWERYGINRGGALKITVNRGDYALIFS